MEYRLLETSCYVDFVQAVNESLFDGWELYGFTMINGEWYSQALTRKTDTESQQQEIYEK